MLKIKEMTSNINENVNANEEEGLTPAQVRYVKYRASIRRAQTIYYQRNKEKFQQKQKDLYKNNADFREDKKEKMRIYAKERYYRLKAERIAAKESGSSSSSD